MTCAKDFLKFQQKFLHDRGSSPHDRACPYRPRSTDVIICGHRRSGTTWLQQILHEIRMRGEKDYLSNMDIDQLVWYIPPYYEKMDFDLNHDQVPTDQSRIFKTHECFEDVPFSDDGHILKYVVLVRNPIDIVWSEKRSRYRQIGYDEDVKDFDDIFRPFGLRPDGSETDTCWDHMLSWFPRRNDPNVFWIHYEDLIADLKLSIQSLSKFIGISLTDQEMDRVHDRCTFRFMEKNSEKFSGRFLTEIRNRTLGVKGRTPITGGLRVDGGKVGDGEKNLDKKLKDAANWFWKHEIEPLTGYKSYSAMYAETNSLKMRGHMRHG